MNKRGLNRCIFTIVVLSLSACATRPVTDPRGIDMVQYERDLYDCQMVAGQVNTGGQMAASATVGALIGAAFGVLTHDVGNAAAFGAVSGGVAGAGDAQYQKAMIVRKCLYNRGYDILN